MLHLGHLLGLESLRLPFGGVDPSRLDDDSLTALPISTSTAALLGIVQQCTGLPNMHDTPDVGDINSHSQCRGGCYHIDIATLKPAHNTSLVNLLAMNECDHLQGFYPLV